MWLKSSSVNIVTRNSLMKRAWKDILQFTLETWMIVEKAMWPVEQKKSNCEPSLKSFNKEWMKELWNKLHDSWNVIQFFSITIFEWLKQ